MDVRVIEWTDSREPTEQAVREVLASEGLEPYRWSNGPGDVYSPHSHTYNKVIYVVQGSIVFGLPDSGNEVALKKGDRLELPAGVRHDAHVGSQGVVCLEAHR